MNLSSLLAVDDYKICHFQQYNPKCELIFSNLTARKSRIDGINKIVFFGLQYFLKEYLTNQWNRTFFNRPKAEVVAEYKRIVEASLGKNIISYGHIEALHELGYLPLEIKALPEGSLVDIRIPCLVLYNTLPEFFWLTNYLETALSQVIWGPITTATISRQYRKILNKYADLTVGNREFVQWQGHNFSARGMFGAEAAAMSGAAHLLNFTGDDTISSIPFLEEYYGANCDNELIAGSVSASEHGIMCLNANYSGEEVNEYENYRRLITEVYPTGIVSLVSDSFDFWAIVTKLIPSLKSEIMARNGKVVIRGDSGDPVKIMAGDKDAQPGSPEFKGLVECLWDTFGGVITDKGYKLLDSHIGAIYGDSITLERCEAICQQLMDKGFCSYNCVYGIGSYTFQMVTRDTFGLAIKATAGIIDGTLINIYKSPKTDDGTKKSAKGLLAVFQRTDNPKDGFTLEQESTWEQIERSELKTVFKNGQLFNFQTLTQIRARLASFGD